MSLVPGTLTHLSDGRNVSSLGKVTLMGDSGPWKQRPSFNLSRGRLAIGTPDFRHDCCSCVYSGFKWERG